MRLLLSFRFRHNSALKAIGWRAMGNRLTLGISEDRDYPHPKIPAARFQKEGPYRSAFSRLNELLEATRTSAAYVRYWDRCLEAGSTLPAATFDEAVVRLKSDMRRILTYECEQARLWSESPPDYVSALRDYKRTAKADSLRIKGALEELKRFDRKHAYLLRHAFDHALQDFMSDAEKRVIRIPNMNKKLGYESRVVSGPGVRQNEFQFLSRLSLFKFDELLMSWNREIDSLFCEWPAHYREFGALRFENALNRTSASKLNVAQLGLIAKLTSRLRDFTAGFGIWTYSTGQPIPDHGKPCWEVVAEFVNCALEPKSHLTGDTTRRVWQSVAAKHKITMQSWPRPAKTELQAQKIAD